MLATSLMGFPLRAMGLPAHYGPLASNEVEPAPWWGMEFEIGRCRHDTQFSAAWHTLFEMFVPIERASRPVSRLVLRGRPSCLRAAPSAGGGPDITSVVSGAALQVIPLPVSAEDVGRLLRTYVAEVPDSVIRGTDMRPELLDITGSAAVEPLGVSSGMIFAAVTRTSYSVRLNWFQFPDSNRASRPSRGRRPRPPSANVVDEPSPPGLGAVVNEQVPDAQHGGVRAQLDDESRARGLNSFARPPAFGGKASEAAPQQSGYRMPESVKKGQCAQSGLRLAAPDHGASLAAPGVQMAEMVHGSKKSGSLVEANAAPLGRVSNMRCVERTGDPDATEALMSNLMMYSAGYELERGFRRGLPRLRVGWPRATLFFPDAPASCTSRRGCCAKCFKTG